MGDRITKYRALYRLFFGTPQKAEPTVPPYLELKQLNESVPETTPNIPEMPQLITNQNFTSFDNITNEVKNKTDQIEVTLKGIHSSLPEISVTGNDKTIMIVVIVAVVVIVLCIFGYCYGVKTAKMKPRQNITVSPQINVNPTLTLEENRPLMSNPSSESST